MFTEIILEESPDKIYKSITLDEVSYDIRIKYLQRLTNEATTPVKADEFILELSLSGGAPFIKTSLKTSRDVLRPFRYLDDCPQGYLILRDYTALNSLLKGGVYQPERVSYGTLGKRFILTYSS